jgi:hypothetical protein
MQASQEAMYLHQGNLHQGNLHQENLCKTQCRVPKIPQTATVTSGFLTSCLPRCLQRDAYSLRGLLFGDQR